MWECWLKKDSVKFTQTHPHKHIRTRTRTHPHTHTVHVKLNKAFKKCKMHFINVVLFQVRAANILGVVGTDVSIDQIIKLVPPYKVIKIWKFLNLRVSEFYLLQLGVNGYSFIVNNNGHVLYHPNLRPLVSFK